MNPEENNNQVPDADSLNQAIAPTPVPAPAPEVAPDSTPAAEAAPSLDQVAADLTSAAATNTLDQAPATPAETSAPAEPTPITEPAPVAEPNPAEQTPAMPAPEPMPASEPVPAPEPTPTAPANPFTEPVQPMPTPEPTPAAPEAPMMPENPTMPGATMTPEMQASPDMPGADAQAANIPVSTPAEEEPPLVPADPVPGSIGSAISYTDATTQPAEIEKPKKPAKLSKDNIRLIAIIGAGIVIVAIVVIVIIAIVSNTGSKKSSNNNNNTPAQPTTPTVSSLTCTKEGGRDEFSAYGEVVSGKEDIVVMYSDGYLSSFGTNLSLGYENEDAAHAGEDASKNVYQQMLTASKLTTDPFDSSYNVVDNSLTVTHQADGDTIDETNARALGLYVVKGEVVDDPDTLIDNYETDGYTCVEK